MIKSISRIQVEKLKLISWIININDPEVLAKIAEIYEESVETPESTLYSENLKGRIIEAERAIENGEYITMEQLKKEFKSW